MKIIKLQIKLPIEKAQKMCVYLSSTERPVPQIPRLNEGGEGKSKRTVEELRVIGGKAPWPTRAVPL